MPEAISVLIPTYNRARFIGECINNILGQTYPDIKIVVYDDGSTDDTVNIAKSFSNIEIIQGGKNNGVSYARNHLLDACTTKYAAWQDSDDLSNIHRIQEQYNAMISTGNFLIGCNCINSSMAKDRAWLAAPLPISNIDCPCMGGIFFNVEIGKKFHFNEQITMGAEDILWIKQIEREYGPRYNVPKQMYYYRTHKDRLSSQKNSYNNKAEKIKSDTVYQLELNKLIFNKG